MFFEASQTEPFHFPTGILKLCSRKLSAGTTQKVVFHLLSHRTDFPETFCKWLTTPDSKS